jgi:hypothetical protein
MLRVIALLVVVALSAAAEAAPGPKSDERKDQEAAVGLVNRLGGQVYYDYQRLPTGEPNLFDPAIAPEDPDKFHRVVAVLLPRSDVSDDDLKAFGKLPALDNLELANTAVTGAGLAHLKGLTKMRVLGLRNTKVDDAGLAHVAGMTKMWSLVLDGTRVTDRGLGHLAAMTELDKWLGLANTEVTDTGLKHLNGMTKLRHLHLDGTKVTAAGVAAPNKKLKRAEVSFDQ